MARIRKENNRTWTKEEKYRIIKPVLEFKISGYQRAKEFDISDGMLFKWLKKYKEKGLEGLCNTKKPGNPLAKYMHKKQLTDIEKLEYENMKLRIENERLKKGYVMKGDGTVVMYKKSKKENLK